MADVRRLPDIKWAEPRTAEHVFMARGEDGGDHNGCQLDHEQPDGAEGLDKRTQMVTIGLKVMLVYATKVLGEYGVGVAVAGSASQDRPGIAQITIMQGGLGLMMSTLMITAPLLVGKI